MLLGSFWRWVDSARQVGNAGNLLGTCTYYLPAGLNGQRPCRGEILLILDLVEKIDDYCCALHRVRISRDTRPIPALQY